MSVLGGLGVLAVQTSSLAMLGHHQIRHGILIGSQPFQDGVGDGGFKSLASDSGLFQERLHVVIMALFPCQIKGKSALLYYGYPFHSALPNPCPSVKSVVKISSELADSC